MREGKSKAKKEEKEILRPEYKKALEESIREYDDLLKELAKL